MGPSGLRGDLERRERARRVIVDRVHRDGTFLEVGYASGLLMETIVPWARARGYALEPYGLDTSARLASLARSRLPHWADRVFVASAIDWAPPRRFDFVRTERGACPDSVLAERDADRESKQGEGRPGEHVDEIVFPQIDEAYPHGQGVDGGEYAEGGAQRPEDEREGEGQRQVQ